MSASNTSLSFSFAFYHHVKYVGECSPVEHPNMFGAQFSRPLDFTFIGSIIFSSAGFILNFISLFIFCASEKGTLLRLRNLTSSTASSDKGSEPVGKNDRNQQSNQSVLSSRASGTPKNSVTLSLLLLSLCECVFTLSKVVFDVLTILGTRFVTNTSTQLAIQIMPVIQNLMFFSTDFGILCRNWCILLITIARAEVVLWPLGTKKRQRILRSRCKFLVAFSCVVFGAIILAYIKHTDEIGVLCFDKTLNQFALWSEYFLMSKSARNMFDAAVYYPLQNIVVWFLILIFSLIIVVRLKPWKHEIDHLFQEKGSKDGTSVGQSVQLDVLKRRQKCQIRATRVVLTVVVVFLLLESVNCILSLLESTGVVDRDSQLDAHISQVGNTLVAIDSICNFFIFTVTLKQFRLALRHLSCRVRKRGQTEGSTAGKPATQSGTPIITSSPSSALEDNSIKIDLE